MAQWQVHTLAMFMTWVRVPGLRYLHNIFQSKFLCSVNIEDASYASKSDHPRVQLNQFKGQDSWNTVGASQRLDTLLGKSIRPPTPWA